MKDIKKRFKQKYDLKGRK